MEFIILLALAISIAGWAIHLLFIITSLFSKERWSVYIDYNRFHEGILELIMMFTCLIITIMALCAYTS